MADATRQTEPQRVPPYSLPPVIRQMLADAAAQFSPPPTASLAPR